MMVFLLGGCEAACEWFLASEYPASTRTYFDYSRKGWSTGYISSDNGYVGCCFTPPSSGFYTVYCDDSDSATGKYQSDIFVYAYMENASNGIKNLLEADDVGFFGKSFYCQQGQTVFLYFFPYIGRSGAFAAKVTRGVSLMPLEVLELK
ncbi:MAG: hypothetical protein K6G80_09560 [Treponema sp.]|nr:hypothetical protein [Treponema sp.]